MQNISLRHLVLVRQCFMSIRNVFEDDPKWAKRAQKGADKTYEFRQFIVDVLKVTDVGASLPGIATIHKSCHMTRMLGVTEAPGILLSNVKGLTVESYQMCKIVCGFGGTFSVKMTPISEQMVDEKVDSAMETGADYLIGADCGCLLNIGGRIERLGKEIKVMHIAEVLNSRS